jgi:hypothetical protein
MKFPLFTIVSMLGCLAMALHSVHKDDGWQTLMWSTFFGTYVKDLHAEFTMKACN